MQHGVVSMTRAKPKSRERAAWPSTAACERALAAFFGRGWKREHEAEDIPLCIEDMRRALRAAARPTRSPARKKR